MKPQNIYDIFNLETSMKSINQSVHNLQSRLDLLESILIKKNDNQLKEITDEIDMVRTGMNNMNHFLISSINDNDKRAGELENRLNGIENKNKITIWLMIVILLLVISEFIVFFYL